MTKTAVVDWMSVDRRTPYSRAFHVLITIDVDRQSFLTKEKTICYLKYLYVSEHNGA